jgi:adenylylsulfate kinase
MTATASPSAPQSCTVWFTGPSGAGKTTLATALSQLIARRGLPCDLLDGDMVRQELGGELGFSRRDRDINVRRIGWVCELLERHGIYTCAAAISPYEEARNEVKRRIARFVLVHCTAPLEVLEARDVKGLYRRARAGLIENFTGIADPYEPPTQPDLVVCSDGRESPAESTARIVALLHQRGHL